MFKYRMIHVDHYMSQPIQPFDDLKSDINGRAVNKVPIIRVFGANPDGIKICLHVHGFYPYIAIQNTNPNEPELAHKIIKEIEASLLVVTEQNKQNLQDHRANSNQPAPARPSDDFFEQETDSNLNSRIQQERHKLTYLSGDQKYPIHRIESIESFNYYGYHNKQENFFKLHLYNPKMVKHLATMFEDCRVLGRFIPVFWAHLPYILLFFIDNNLRGMQFIEVDQIYWRKNKAPRPDSQMLFSPRQPQAGPSNSISEDMNPMNDPEIFTTDTPPISSCELEADIRFEWILNRQRFGSKGNDDALRELWLDDQESTRGSSLIDQRLPIFNIERDYLQYLCGSYAVDCLDLDLELARRPNRNDARIPEPSFSDSDHSNDAHDQYAISSPEVLDRSILAIEAPAASEVHNMMNESQNSRPACDDDEFSDDDDFLNLVPKIESVPSADKINITEPFSKLEPIPGSSIKLEPNITLKLEPETHVKSGPKSENIELKVTPKVESDVKHEINLTNEFNEDEFSDDDQLLLNAVIKAQTQANSQKSNLQPTTNTSSEEKATDKKARKFYSDNSMIDGRSEVCSTANQTKNGSQRSTSSSRETVNHEYQYLCLMSMELHITTREQLRPDPAFDPIEAVFYCVRNDIPETLSKPTQVLGLVLTDPFRMHEDQLTASPNPLRSPGARSNMSFAQKVRSLLHRTGLSQDDIKLSVVDTELELIMTLVELVKLHDPEIMIGYEMEYLSWGYVLERSGFLNLRIGLELSRISENKLSRNSTQVDSNFVQPIMFAGRMVFSTWRIIKHDIHLNTCSYEKIHHHALGERVPRFDFSTLTGWFNENRNRWRVIDYYLIRVVGQMRILDKFDLIAKVSELARVYGTQFIDVITRGSQIGIESMMLRLAKLQNLSPLSPTVMQRHKMLAPEAIPLVMEPETNIYYDPVAVLDFQSLYPSVVIAYNYCYSTCLGRVSDLEKKERHHFGCSHLYVDEAEVKRLLQSNNVHVSPCGVAYVKKNIRHGVLPKMLSELIVTRAMVKEQMKKNMKSERPNKRLQRILDHRQHGLKMMANTTYGYTGASYTGRMPCVEIADSIVSKGRETLENAIDLVESRAEWGAKVIYGDTDSIFIQFKGCDRDTAFKRAYEMVSAISAANPHPIKMKFEKIYQPCVLQTKKRYCGFKFECPEQTKPEFEAKGIETVRRDCCPAAARMLEMALRIQFTTRDIKQVKRYVQHQFVKIISGKLSNIQDFIFARQYKPRDLDKSESVFVPAWQITKRLLATDPRIEPRVGERVPFVIIYGEQKTPLVNLAKTPYEVLQNVSYRINSDYYIQKIICPTLNRVFCTMKEDTLLWYKEMPRQNIVHRSHYLIAQKNQLFSSGQSTMSQYFSPSHCPVCAKSVLVSDDICDECRSNLQSSTVRLTEEISKNQRKLFAYHLLCRACSSLERTDNVDQNDEHHNPCISYDCQNLFRYHQAKLDALNSNFLAQILKELN